MADYSDQSTWMSYDDVPHEAFNSGYNTGFLPQHMVDLVIAQNRGEERTSTPSMSMQPGGNYGANPNPTMGIQQGGVGSVPGASSEYNQLSALSGAKNDAIGEFGGWDKWQGAGAPTDIFAGMPNAEAMRNRAGPSLGAPPEGYLQSAAFKNRPGQWQTELPGSGPGQYLGPPQQQQPPSNLPPSWQNPGGGTTMPLGDIGQSTDPYNLPTGTGSSQGGTPAMLALTQALANNWGG